MSGCCFLIAALSCLKLSSPLAVAGAGAAAATAGSSSSSSLSFSLAKIFANLPTFSSLFRGYSPLVLSIVTLQALGGLVTALVVKKTNSVVKGFTTSGAVVLSCVVSRYLFPEFKMTPLFYLGAAVVSGATITFARASPGLQGGTCNPKYPHPRGNSNPQRQQQQQ
jgi:hypothetical protein